MRVLSLASFAALFISWSATAGVIVVDAANGPGTDFTTFGPALAQAAQTGGIILVRSGTYTGPHIATLAAGATEVVIVADEGATVRFESALGGVSDSPLAIDAAAGSLARRVVVRGIEFAQLDTVPLVDNLLADAAVAVGSSTVAIDAFMQECTATQTLGPGASFGGGRRTIVSGCTLFGGDPIVALKPSGVPIGTTFPGAGLAVGGTTADRFVWVFDSTCVGGKGRPQGGIFQTGYIQNASPGAAGIFAIQQTVAPSRPWGIVDCSAVGGEGGDGLFLTSFCEFPEDGGPGLHVFIKPQIITVASTFDGGPPGQPGNSPICTSGTATNGADILFEPTPAQGSVTDLVGTPGRALAPRAWREGESKSIGVQGVPGDQAFLIFGLQTTGVYALAITGALVVDPLLVLPIGPIGNGGSTLIPLAYANLGTGVEGLPVYFQAFTANPTSGQVCAGAPAVTLLLDSQF